MSQAGDNVEQALGLLGQGKMIVLVDSVHRENEGDLMMPAECVDAAAINFMSKFGRGLICLTLTTERCQLLGLNPMRQGGSTRNGTNFVDSIDAAEGVSTGISAADRARTIAVAVDPRASAQDLRHPGHIFPLQAVDGGVLVRAGHTEAGCDMARLAGYSPASVIVEILNEDGTMARRDDLVSFCGEHSLFMLDIDELIEYRLLKERIVDKVGTRDLDTRVGKLRLHLFRDLVHHHHHLAVQVGEPISGDATLVRVHRSKYLFDLLRLDSQGGQQSWDFHSSLQYLFDNGGGVLLLLNEARQRDLPSLDRLLCEQFDRLTSIHEGAPSASGADSSQGAWGGSSERETGIGSQILKALNMHNITLLGRSQQVHYHGLRAFGINIENIIEYPDKP